MKHAKTPWTRGDHVRGVIYSADNMPVALIKESDVGGINAARIVACVNACEGMPTQSLEFMTISGENPGRRILDLVDEVNKSDELNAKMLGVLRKLMSQVDALDVKGACELMDEVSEIVAEAEQS